MIRSTGESLNSGDAPRVLMLGTFAMHPKGTMSARAAGMASALIGRGWDVRIGTVPWDNPAEAGRRYEFNGVPVFNTKTISPRLTPLAVRELLAEATEFRPHLIHLFKPKGFGDLAARVLQRRGVPVIVDMDDWEGDGGWNDRLPYSSLQRRLFQWQETSWPSRADAVTAASRTLHAYARQLGASPYRCDYLPNQLNTDRIDELIDPPEPDPSRYPAIRPVGRPRILLYTRFVEFEPSFLVELLKDLGRRGCDAEIVVAGRSADGAPEREIRRALQTIDVSPSIVWLDWIEPEHLGWISRQCSVALVSFEDSLINRAKCSVKLLELLATGIPVVASNVGENREYIFRHAGGVLARPGNVSDHVDRLIDLLQAPQHSRQISNSHTMNWSHLADQIENLYHRCISESPRS
jgi:glycosyltransferase involved in cell wall biosynthesis